MEHKIIKIERTYRCGGLVLDIFLEPIYIDSDDPKDGLERLYEDLMFRCKDGRYLDLIATEVKEL